MAKFDFDRHEKQAASVRETRGFAVSETQHVTREEFVQAVNAARRGYRFHVNIRNDSERFDSDGNPTGRTFYQALSSSVELPRKEAMRVGLRMLTPQMEDIGARLGLYVTVWDADGGRTKPTYHLWFG